MRRGFGWRGLWLVLSLASAWPAMASSTGSWIASTVPMRVAVPERDTTSRPLAPASGIAAGATITRLNWRFEAPSRPPLQAWLCHPVRCIPLSSPSGQTRALAGLAASEPLYFRFRLARGARPVEIKGLQLIVDYR